MSVEAGVGIAWRQSSSERQAARLAADNGASIAVPSGGRSLEIRALPELTQGQGRFAVQIVDLSPGGCCLKSPQQVPAGYRIRLSADRDAENTTAIPLRVQWQKPADQGVLVGCSFCHASGYALLAAQAFEQPTPGASSASPRLLDRMFYLALGAVGLTAATTQA
jgi:hypothetical protein